MKGIAGVQVLGFRAFRTLGFNSARSGHRRPAGFNVSLADIPNKILTLMLGTLNKRRGSRARACNPKP